MVWRRWVVKECRFLKLTPRSFLGGSKLYSLCEGLDRMELRAYHIRTLWRSCKETRPVELKATHRMNNLDR